MQTFYDVVVPLAKNPLGIIALAFVLIYGVAGFLTTQNSLEPGNKKIMVWFLALFPVLVLGVFTYLVVFHHTKLYAPYDYKDEKIFSGLAVVSSSERSSIEQTAKTKGASKSIGLHYKCWNNEGHVYEEKTEPFLVPDKPTLFVLREGSHAGKWVCGVKILPSGFYQGVISSHDGNRGKTGEPVTEGKSEVHYLDYQMYVEKHAP